MTNKFSLNFLLIIIGVLSSQKISMGGEIYFGELFCAAIILFNFKHLYLPSNTRIFVLLLFIWGISQFISDSINQTDMINAMKGILAPVFILIILLGLNTVFHNKNKYIPIYLIGVFVGLIINKVFYGSLFFALNPWKWGLGGALAYLFFIWIEFYVNRDKRNLFLFIGCLVFFCVSILYSSRSLGFFMLISGVIPLSAKVIINSKFYKHLSSSSLGFLELFCLLGFIIFAVDRAMVALFTFKPFLDLLPPLDAIKYSLQANSEWGPILGGRSEFLVSIQAFLDAPFFGHGSWATDPKYVYALLDAQYESGNLLKDLESAENLINSFLIPTHSYLMGAMVYGGVGAGVFWFKVIAMSISGFLQKQVILSPLLVYISIALIWNTLFSPFGADARWISTILLWIHLLLVDTRK